MLLQELFQEIEFSLTYYSEGRGKIVNTASVCGVYGNVGQTNYSASKAAIIGITKMRVKEFDRKGVKTSMQSYLALHVPI